MKTPLSLLFLLAPLCALAHQGSTCYLTLLVEESRVYGRWEIPVRDLDLALGLDIDVDHKVSQSELELGFEEIKSFALPKLALKLDEIEGTLWVTNTIPVVEEFVDGASLALDFVVTNTLVSRTLEVSYRFMFEEKPLEQAFMQLQCGGVTQTAIFTPQETTHRFDLEVRRERHEVLSFLWHGVHHIWIGYDHILFLLALLLPAVLRFEEGRWRAVREFREAFVNVVKVVTAFTVAHSITLSLAALHIVSLPSRWVEAAIALSVLLAAVNNIRVFFQGPIWLVAFGFGLVHGFGFANVLSELGLPRNVLILALIGFNLGVELGQLAIVLVFLPVAYVLRHSPFYRQWVLRAGSALIAVVALLWLFERLFDITLL